MCKCLSTCVDVSIYLDKLAVICQESHQLLWKPLHPCPKSLCARLWLVDGQVDGFLRLLAALSTNGFSLLSCFPAMALEHPWLLAAVSEGKAEQGAAVPATSEASHVAKLLECQLPSLRFRPWIIFLIHPQQALNQLWQSITCAFCKSLPYFVSVCRLHVFVSGR